MNRDQVRHELIQIFVKGLQETPPMGFDTYTLSELVCRKLPSDSHPSSSADVTHYMFEIVYEWMRAGMLYFGIRTDPNSKAPHITVTDFGKECFLTGNFLPYDPEGYVRALQKQVPQIDEVTLRYVKESVSTYNSEHLLSSTITLGVASENIILNLIDTFCDAIADADQKDALIKKFEKERIYKKYTIFIDELKNYKKQLPKNFGQDLETNTGQIFNFIRMNRNQSGHPTGKTVSKKVAYSNMQIFAEYAKTLFDAISRFQQNKI